MNRCRSGEIRSFGAPEWVLEEVEGPVSDELIIGRHSQPQPTPTATFGEAPREAASFNHALHRTAGGGFRPGAVFNSISLLSPRARYPGSR